DLSLVDWANPAIEARSSDMPVTAIHADVDELMRRALEMLDALLEGATPAEPRVLVPSRLYPGATTGPAPRAAGRRGKT
ncbi:MAG: substrate-binding domain-containing protein, partial [Lentisphaerae bacterium]|nr:substrate-binding domain-containing protein [Lentisphaerota bacterium]